MPNTMDVDQAFPRVRAALTALADWIKRADHRRANDNEFQSLAPADLDAIAHDLGISVGDLRAVSAKGRDAAALLLKRMTALHLDPETIAHKHPAVMHDLERLCSTCKVHGRCRRDMLRDPDDPVWKSYCPNVETLEALRVQS